MDLTMAFAVHGREPPAIEVRVNFGIFAGREATPAEIDRLAEELLDEVGEVSIISEDRHEIDGHVEASVHQVRIEVARDLIDGDLDELERRVVERADHWARTRIADRHARVAQLQAPAPAAAATRSSTRSAARRASGSSPLPPKTPRTPDSAICARHRMQVPPLPSGSRSKLDSTCAPPPRDR